MINKDLTYSNGLERVRKKQEGLDSFSWKITEDSDVTSFIKESRDAGKPLKQKNFMQSVKASGAFHFLENQTGSMQETYMSTDLIDIFSEAVLNAIEHTEFCEDTKVFIKGIRSELSVLLSIKQIGKGFREDIEAVLARPKPDRNNIFDKNTRNRGCGFACIKNIFLEPNERFATYYDREINFIEAPNTFEIVALTKLNLTQKEAALENRGI